MMEGDGVLETGVSDSVATEQAPMAIGAYSQGITVRAGATLLFTSGQLPIDRDSGTIPESDPAAQCTLALRNALAIVEAAGGTITDVVRSTLYILDMTAFERINEAYAAVFKDHRPARSVIGVSALPRGAGVEIELVAALPVMAP